MRGLEPDGRPGWLTLLLAGGGAVAVYGAALVLLRVDELRALHTLIRSMLTRVRSRTA